jgi:hypothetical protein
MKLPSCGARRALARALAACLLLAGCISVEIASQVAPEFREQRFLRTMVVADVGMLHERTLAEDLIVERLRDRRIDALRSLDVVFGADTLPVEAFFQHAAEAGADAVLILRVHEEGELGYYVPPTADSTYYTTEHDGVVVGHGSTHVFGGGSVIRPWATFRATLIETATGKTAWFADATADGTASSSPSDLVKRVAGKIAERLGEDGILKAEQRL